MTFEFSLLAYLPFLWSPDCGNLHGTKTETHDKFFVALICNICNDLIFVFSKVRLVSDELSRRTMLTEGPDRQV